MKELKCPYCEASFYTFLRDTGVQQSFMCLGCGRGFNKLNNNESATDKSVQSVLVV